jgi:hypothetical protein
VDAAKYYDTSEVVINTLVTASNCAQIIVVRAPARPRPRATAPRHVRARASSLNFHGVASLALRPLPAPLAQALVWTMNMEAQHGLQVPYIVGSALLLVGGWLSFYGAQPSHWGLIWVFVGVLLSSAGATFLCTLPVPLSSRWFPFEERTFATAVGAMSLVCGIACAYVLQAALHRHIPRFLLLNALLSTTTLPLAPLFRDPPNRNRALGVDAAEQGALLARSAAASAESSLAAAAAKGIEGVQGAASGVALSAGLPLPVTSVGGASNAAALDSVRINTILWLTDWRVALLLLGSTYILGMGFTFLTLIDEVLPPDIQDIKTILAVVFLFSGMTGMVAIGSFVDATKEYIGTLRAVLIILVASYVVMAVAWQYSQQALLYASTSLVAASTFAVMPVSLEIAVELTYHSGVELEGAINSWIAVIGSSVFNSVTIYVADPNILGVPLVYTGWLWLGFVLLGAAVLVPVEGRLHRTEDEGRRRAMAEGALAVARAEEGGEGGGGCAGGGLDDQDEVPTSTYGATGAPLLKQA